MSASIYWSVALYFIQDIGSRLAWGVWVEISDIMNGNVIQRSRLAWGVWVEIFDDISDIEDFPESRLAWGVWVEIDVGRTIFSGWLPSRLAWGVWVEMSIRLGTEAMVLCHASHEACELKYSTVFPAEWLHLSRLAWGVWVEIRHT